MTQWRKLLKSLGFTESEATIYLVSLEMGPASVQDLAKKANVSRVTTYAVIESLMKNGLMSTLLKGKKNLFVAEAPERLVSHVQSKVKTMEATLHEVSNSLQELKLIQRGEKPVVKMFEGEEALQAVQDDILKTQPREIAEFGNLDDIRKAFAYESRLEHAKKVSRHSPAFRFIYTAHESGDIQALPTNNQNQRLTNKQLDFHGDVTIYGNKVALASFGTKPIAVIIESKNIADTLKALFNEHWTALKK